jgi:hypothetical protein
MTDKNLLRGIGRSNLDSFRARGAGTVKSNLGTMQWIVRVHESAHGIKRGSMFQPQGSHPVGDVFGMKMEVSLLDHYLNAGLNEFTVQFNTT